MLPVVFLLLIGVIFIAIISLWLYQTFSRSFTLLNKVPGPPCYPIIGNLLSFFTVPDKLFKIDREFAKKYYPIYKEWTFGYAGVNLYHPDDFELVLSSSKHNNKSFIYNYLHAWLGTGLLTSGGAKWQTRRKILTPAFHFTILQEFVPIFNEEIKKIVQELKKYCKDGPVNVVAPVSQFTLFSIAETSMGVKLDNHPKSCNDYKEAIYIFGHTFTYRMLRPWLFDDTIFYNLTKFGRKTRKAIEVLHNFSRNVISERKRNTSPKQTKRMAMLDLLLSAKAQGADIDDEGIAEEVDTFMFEGHDTTAVAICNTLLVLANHQSIQQQIFEEINDVLGFPPRNPTYNDLKELRFMERCLKESLRLFPSVPFISRILSEEITTATGYVIPKNTAANLHIYDLHRNPEIYLEPEKFDPDRFLPENTKNRHPYAYLPFSAGPRNCIGQKYAMLELKAALCGILGSFILEPKDKIEDVTMITDLVLRSKKGIQVKFTIRK